MCHDLGIAYVELTVNLGLEGERLDPEGAARRLGIPATKSGHAGDRLRSGRLRKASYCYWSARPPREFPNDLGLERFALAVRPLDPVEELIHRQVRPGTFNMILNRHRPRWSVTAHLLSLRPARTAG